MTIKGVHKLTGEQIELEVNNSKEMVEAYRMASEYEKLGERLKEKLKKELPKYLDEDGKSVECDGYQFKTYPVQKKTYDKSVMREILDEDTYDLLLVPDKKAIDEFLKEAVERFEANDLGKLRDTMIANGNAYTVVKLDKLS